MFFQNSITNRITYSISYNCSDNEVVLGFLDGNVVRHGSGMTACGYAYNGRPALLES